MNVESTDLNRTLAIARRMCTEQDCRCATCNRSWEAGRRIADRGAPGRGHEAKSADDGSGGVTA